MKRCEDVKVNWGYLELGMRAKQAGLEKAREVNASRDRLMLDLQRTECLLNDINAYRDRLKVLGARVAKENDHFRTSRLEYLNASITDAIAEVFPDKKLKAEVSCDFKRQNAVGLKLVDGEGNSFKPNICNGKLMQYLISFSSVSKIAESLGYHNLFVDEAFGVASVGKLPVVGDSIMGKVRDGVQVVLVSQNPVLYSDVPRREIRLHYDSLGKKAVLDEVVDI